MPGTIRRKYLQKTKPTKNYPIAVSMRETKKNKQKGAKEKQQHYGCH